MRSKLLSLLAISSFLILAFDKKELKTIQSPKPKNNKDYNNIIFYNEENLKSSAGTKSVLFNATGTKLYAMNLEGLSVYKYNRENRQLNRQFQFKANKGIGWDYQTKSQ